MQHNPQDATTTPAKFEIAQISVLIEMPSIERSMLYGRPKSHLKPTDDEDEDTEILPELVIGYARCHKHWWMDTLTENKSSHQPQ